MGDSKLAEVKVLVQGYVRDDGDAEVASSTTTLIRENGVNVIVDPGMNRQMLLDALKKEGLSPEKIDFVILTHYHMDHVLLAGIFTKAKVFDNELSYSWDGKIEEHGGTVPGTGIKLINTPGHDLFHCTVLVNAKEFGKVAVAGDVLWWNDGETQKLDKKSLINREDPYMKDWDALKKSRKEVLNIAEYIIPGHGKPFKLE